MRTRYPLLALLTVALAAALTAQTVRQVDFADVQNTTLDLIIQGDIDGLAANDSAAHLIYELERDRPFFFSGQLEWEDAHVELRPQDGNAGAPPLIIQQIGTGGESVDQLFRMRGISQLTLRGLVLTGRTNQGTYNDRIVRTSGDENVITIDECAIDDVGQAAFRINGDGERIYITNSTFNRLGRPSNPDNGRLFDNRSDGLDTLWFENNVVTNVTSRFYRSSADDVSEYVYMNRNTFVGAGQHGFDVREGAETFIFTNNIVADAIFLGRDTEDSFDSLGMRLPDARTVIQLDTVNPMWTTVIENNNFFERQSSLDALPDFEVDDDGGQGDAQSPITGFYLNPAAQQAIGATDATGAGTSNFSEHLDFTTGPASYAQFITARAQDTTSGNEIPAADPFDTEGLDAYTLYSGINLGSTEPIDRFVAFYDLCYDPASRSASAAGNGVTGAIGGQVEDCAGLSVPARAAADALGLSLAPNPTHGTVLLRLPEVHDDLDVTVLDAQGRVVRRLQAAGDQLGLDLSREASGLYFVRVATAAGQTSVLRVVRR